MFMNYLPVWFAVGISIYFSKKGEGLGCFWWYRYVLLLHHMYWCIAKAQGWTADTVTVEHLIEIGYTQEAALNFNALWIRCWCIYFQHGYI